MPIVTVKCYLSSCEKEQTFDSLYRDKFMNYIENLVKERLRKKLDRNIDFALFDEIKKEYKELDNKIKKNNQ